MPPPSRAASSQLDVFLASSIRRAQYTLASCGVGWLILGCWVAFCAPGRIGPPRMIAALALVVATCACALVWWFARSWQQWLMVVLTELIPQTHNAGEPASGNPRSLADASRR